MCAAVAGEAGDVLFPVWKFGIDFPRHHDHLARGFFVRVFIAGIIAFDVTEGTLLTQSNSKSAHGGADFRRL